MPRRRACETIITKKQQALLDYIRNYRMKHGYSPTCREMADHIGHASTNDVYTKLDALEAKGAIRRTLGVARSFLLTEHTS